MKGQWINIYSGDLPLRSWWVDSGNECEKPGSTKFVEVKGTHNNGWCVLVTANEVETAKKKPVDLFIVNKINYRWIDDEFECYDGELRIISPWKPKSNKSSLKEISYKFCPEK